MFSAAMNATGRLMNTPTTVAMTAIATLSTIPSINRSRLKSVASGGNMLPTRPAADPHPWASRSGEIRISQRLQRRKTVMTR